MAVARRSLTPAYKYNYRCGLTRIFSLRAS